MAQNAMPFKATKKGANAMPVGNGGGGQQQQPQQVPDDSPGGGYGYGYGYGGGGGGYGGGSGGGGGNDGEPSDVQKETAKNLRPIVHFNYDTLPKKHELGNKVYDTADDQSKALKDWSAVNAMQNASEDWYRQQQKLQSSMKNMRSEMGNAAYGSDFLNMYDAFARADDQMDDDTLQALRKNLDDIDANYYDAIMNNVNSRNKLAADTEISMRELGADWAAQLNNIHPQLVNGEYMEGVTGYGEDRKEGDKPDDAEDFDKLIDREKDTLTFPEWFNINYASENWADAIKPERRKLYRPDMTAILASKSGERSRATNNSSAANRSLMGISSYLQGYSGNMANRRTQ